LLDIYASIAFDVSYIYTISNYNKNYYICLKNVMEITFLSLIDIKLWGETAAPF